MLDSSGNQMKCIGGWNDPENLTTFSAVMSLVHERTHGRTGPYLEACSECMKVHQGGKSGGCLAHKGSPRPQRSGNVTHSIEVRDTILKIKKDSGHQVNGACHLLPSDLREIGGYCSSSNDPFLFMICVMLLLSIDLFLRQMEFISLHYDNFMTNMFVMSDEFIVEALNLRVKGKAKRHKKKGALHCVMLCFMLRHATTPCHVH